MTPELPHCGQLPRFLVCEDGDEYTERFRRFLSSRFDFERAADFELLVEALATPDSAVGLLFDLDFRRTPLDRLVDEMGQSVDALSAEERRRLAAHQGLAILHALRHRGVKTPAILFADFDNASQLTFLEHQLKPLQIVPSVVGLDELSRLLAALASRSGT